MRVLSGRVLVTVPKKQSSESSLIIEQDTPRRGSVYLTGSNEVKVSEEVMFGEEYEEIEVGGDHRAFLMHEDNIKIIFGESNGK